VTTATAINSGGESQHIQAEGSKLLRGANDRFRVYWPLMGGGFLQGELTEKDWKTVIVRIGHLVQPHARERIMPRARTNHHKRKR
jgi:hypothetical protein